MKRIKVQCGKCGGFYSKSNIHKHKETCDGNIRKPKTKRETCEFCGKDFKGMNASQRANHARWCKDNPLAEEYRVDLKKRASKIRLQGGIDYSKIGDKIRLAHQEGRYDGAKVKQKENPYWRGRNHTEKTKEVLREKALASKHRRLVKSTRVYKKKEGTEVLLDSSWEEELAIRLDILDIEWVRPEPIVWEDAEGKKHNYFPDFYLTSYNLYVDPKNPQARKVQSCKIEKIQELYDNVEFLWTIEEVRNFVPCPRHRSSKPDH